MLLYDIWKDNGGFIHILPQGSYRLIIFPASAKEDAGVIRLVIMNEATEPDEPPTYYDVHEGALLKCSVTMQDAVLLYKRDQF